MHVLNMVDTFMSACGIAMGPQGTPNQRLVAVQEPPPGGPPHLCLLLYCPA